MLKYKNKLFIVQKLCLRIMFGDTEAYLNKFKTCCRVRPYQEQILGSEFYSREHSKPLFTKNDIMTVHNLYKYHTTLAALKLLKFRTPISLYSCFNISHRKETLLITPKPSTSFFPQSTSLWNVIRDILYIKDFSIKLSKVKRQLKGLIIQRQKLGDQEEWADENFKLR